MDLNHKLKPKKLGYATPMTSVLPMDKNQIDDKQACNHTSSDFRSRSEVLIMSLLLFLNIGCCCVLITY